MRQDFTKYGLGLLSSGYKGEELRELLFEFTETMYDRAQVQVGVLKTMASFAPAFGMIGTLVGLIIMLDNLKADAGQLGQGLALALITTLYGVITANLIFKPAALIVNYLFPSLAAKIRTLVNYLKLLCNTSLQYSSLFDICLQK